MRNSACLAHYLFYVRCALCDKSREKCLVVSQILIKGMLCNKSYACSRRISALSMSDYGYRPAVTFNDTANYNLGIALGDKQGHKESSRHTT